MGIGDRLKKIADDVARECKEVLFAEVVEVVDRGRAMWDDDGSQTWSMHVGSFREYEIVKVETRCLFGIRWLRYKKKIALVAFGGHEFFDDGRLREAWCFVCDARIEDIARRLIGPIGDWETVKFTVSTASPS
jgi:hypothetical protein